MGLTPVVKLALQSSDWTALHQAALGNQAEAVEVLLEAGADANVESLPGSPCYDTPLLAAVESMSNEALRVLLRNGADPNKPDNNGSTPLHLAAHEQTPGIMEVVDLLLRWGASEAAVDKHGNTPAEILQRLAIHRPDATEERAGALVLLARAPADRAWRRRGWVVMLRARSETERIAAQRRGATSSSEMKVSGRRARLDEEGGHSNKVGRAGDRAQDVGATNAVATGGHSTGSGIWSEWVSARRWLGMPKQNSKAHGVGSSSSNPNRTRPQAGVVCLYLRQESSRRNHWLCRNAVNPVRRDTSTRARPANSTNDTDMKEIRINPWLLSRGGARCLDCFQPSVWLFRAQTELPPVVRGRRHPDATPCFSELFC